MITKQISACARKPRQEIQAGIDLAKQTNEDVMLVFGDVVTFVNKDSIVGALIPELYEKMNLRNYINFIAPRQKQI